MHLAWNDPLGEILKTLNTSTGTGLSDEQVLERQKKFGLNTLPPEKKRSLVSLILDQFSDSLVRVLVTAAIVSLAVSYWEGGKLSIQGCIEPAIIFAILIANAAISVFQERNTTAAIAALSDLVPDFAMVLRNGMSLAKISAKELVPGDIIQITIGDRIPADCRIANVIGGGDLRIDQSLLTGESESVLKETENPTPSNDDCLQNRKNCLFSGTLCTAGKVLAVVTETGRNSQLGKIHTSMLDTSQRQPISPLRETLDSFGVQLGGLIGIICVMIWCLNIFSSKYLSGGESEPFFQVLIREFKIAVALAVAAIPEGLSVIVTTCLALGSKRMVKRNALVRKLDAVETLGCCTVICCDKTGTLTENAMNVTTISFPLDEGLSIQKLSIEGSSYSPFGLVRSSTQVLDGAAILFPQIESCSLVCSLANESRIEIRDSSGTTYTRLGDSTECALRVLVERLETADPANNAFLKGMPVATRCNAVNDQIWVKHEIISIAPFDRERKRMSVLVRNKENGSCRLLMKGAPEVVLSRCSRFSVGKSTYLLSGSHLEQLEREVDHMTSVLGLRVLALASKETSRVDEAGLTFLGLVGMLDTPRSGISDMMKRCKSAGLKILIITGDNPGTATSIYKTACAEIGASPRVIVASQLDKSIDKKTLLRNVDIVARVEPRHKKEIVQLLQQSGNVVAMTGDGVNDAAALKAADIGIAMGSGCDVARLASSLVLADDNFSSIILAIEEGRIIFENIRLFIRYLISSNIGEVISIVLSSLLGIKDILLPIHLLWINLVTDGLPATALSLNPGSSMLMRQKPRKRSEPLITSVSLLRYFILGLYIAIATVGGYLWDFNRYNGNRSKESASSVALTVVILVEMANAANNVSDTESLFVFPIWRNLWLLGAITLTIVLHVGISISPTVAAFFQITPLSFYQWKVCILLSLPIIAIDEIFKLFLRKSLAQKKQKVE